MKYEGQTITLTGNPGDRGLITFGRVEPNGISHHVGLELNKSYRVGELDENGKVIEDWVYEAFLDSDYNYNRKKSKAEVRRDQADATGGVSKKIGQID